MSNEFGYKLNNPVVTRQPLALESFESDRHTDFGAVKKIVFIGKFSHQKGWPDFIEVIEALAQQGQLSAVEEVIAFAPDMPQKSEVKGLAKICSFRYEQLSRQDLYSFIRTYKNEALFILPYKGENYPYAILELIIEGCRLLAYDSGGISEIVDDVEYKQYFFINHDVNRLINRAISIINGSPLGYQEIIHRTKICKIAQQRETNSTYRISTAENFESITQKIQTLNYHQNLVTIATPVYNTKLEYLNELLCSILNSSVQPVEWLLVDDGSTAEYSRALLSFISSNSEKLRIRYVAQNNTGLAGARNRCLQEVQTTFAFFIDSDDVLLPHSVAQGLVAMNISAEVAAVTGFSMDFDGAALMASDATPITEGAYWMPLGIPEARAYALLENQFMPSCSLVRTEQIRQLGGWDASDKSTWEDWAFFSRLAWSDVAFGLIPNMGFLYRNTPGSMAKTYNQYLGRRRLVRNVPGLSRLDANILSAMSMAADPRGEDGQHRLEVLLSATYASRSWRLTAPLRWLTDAMRKLADSGNELKQKLFKK